MYLNTSKNTFTLVTLQTFVWLGVYIIIPPVVQTSVHFSIFILHFLSWYYTWNAETLQVYLSEGVLSSTGIRF